MQSELRPGSPTADALKGSKQSAFKRLDKMPAGEVFYIGMNMSPAMVKSLGSMMTGMVADPDAKGGKALAEAVNEWAKTGPSQSVAAMKYPLAGVSVAKSADPDKTLAAAIKMFKAMGAGGAYQNANLKKKPEIKEKAEKYKDIEFTSVHMVFDWDKTMAATGGQQLPAAAKKAMVQGMKKLMGESLNTWVGSDGKEIVQVYGKDWAAAKKLLDQYFEGTDAVGADKAFVARRKELPHEATFLMEMDVIQYGAAILDFMKPMLAASAPGVAANIPNPVKGTPGYIGMAVTLSPDAAALTLSSHRTRSSRSIKTTFRRCCRKASK